MPRNCFSETGFPFSSGSVKSGALLLISMMQYLYLNSRRRAIAIAQRDVTAGAALCGAQIRDRTQHQPPPPGDNNQTQLNAKKAKHGPRAIAVLEFLPGGGARLVPVALWIDDRFYDASLYGANPAPMALEPETVYEATNYGESTGLFTVTTPEQVKGNWVAAGQWKPHRTLDDRLAKQAASKPKQAKADNPIDDRPVLKRAGSGGSSSGSSGDGSSSSGTSSSSGGGSSTTTSTSPSSPEPSDRPTLKKPSEESSAPPASQPQATNATRRRLRLRRPLLTRTIPIARCCAAARQFVYRQRIGTLRCLGRSADTSRNSGRAGKGGQHHRFAVRQEILSRNLRRRATRDAIVVVPHELRRAKR